MSRVFFKIGHHEAQSYEAQSFEWAGSKEGNLIIRKWGHMERDERRKCVSVK